MRGFGFRAEVYFAGQCGRLRDPKGEGASLELEALKGVSSRVSTTRPP